MTVAFHLYGMEEKELSSRTPNDNYEAEKKVTFPALPRITGTFTLATEKVAKNKLSHKYILQRMENLSPHQSFFFFFCPLQFASSGFLSPGLSSL